LGQNHLDLAISYNNMGNTYKSMKMYNEAVEAYEKSLRLKMKSMKNNEYHISIATTLNNLALAYKGKEEYEKAIKYLKESLKIKNKLLD
jgi:tetratricopeptide (TPR) repeat protein